MMKGIQLKKFNELRVRLNEKNTFGFNSAKEVADSEEKNAANQDLDNRVNQNSTILIVNREIANFSS
jgi:hypothetical protein